MIYTFVHDGRVVFQTSGNEYTRDSLPNVWKKKWHRNAIPFEVVLMHDFIHGYAIQPKKSIVLQNILCF